MNNDGHGPRAHGVPIADGLSGRAVEAVGRGGRGQQELLKPSKYLEVGFTPDEREIIINFPADILTPAHHVVFSPAQARHLAKVLLRKADECKR